ncbi:MAG: YXWGXW repeat-containing protein [Planctomycetaceae bacterium]|nr:YXWGXW repeat-containing protein [Planctomycetaceae bacterium]
MRKEPIPQLGVALTLLLGLLASLSSCYVEPYHEVDGYYGDDVYVREAVPPPRTQVIVGTAPGPDYVWVGGYWSRYRNNWHWIDGRWAHRPRPNAVWVDGRWDHHPQGYRWNHGHWR